MRRQGHFLAVIGLSFLLAGCAVETAEFKSMREQVRLQQKQIVDLKAKQQQQEAKLEVLDDGFKLLGSKVEENWLRTEDFKKSGEAIPKTSPVVSAPERAVPSPAAVPAVSPVQTPPSTSDREPAFQPTPSAADLYRSALDNFTQENYQRAILEFEEFVANHPDHDLADNAQYWVGECYYSQKKYTQAVVEFEKVELHFSAGNKAPAAMLKKGLALKETGKNNEAIIALEKVVSMYPESDERTVAEKRLSQWR